MKPFIVGFATVLLSVFILVFNQDYRQNNYYCKELKYVAEEASASASLFTNSTDYSNGCIVFNQIEGNKAVKAQIINLLRLDNSLNPLSNSYWTDTISYKVYYFDDSNTSYPFLFKDTDTLFTQVVTDPTVVVTINAGKGRYRIPLFKNTGNFIRSAAHELKRR